MTHSITNITPVMWDWAKRYGKQNGNAGPATTLRHILEQFMVEHPVKEEQKKKEDNKQFQWIKVSIHEDCYGEAVKKFKAEEINTPNATAYTSTRRSVCQWCNRIVQEEQEIIVTSLPAFFINGASV